MQPPVLHMASPAAESAIRSQNPVGVCLCGGDLLLKTRQKLLRLGQSQTQIGDIAKTIRPVDLHYVGTAGLAIHPRSNQPQNPSHPRSPSRQNAGPVVTASSSSPLTLDAPPRLKQTRIDPI